MPLSLIHISSSLGITPQNDGESIRLNLPELTQQRRVELKKMVNKMAAEGRVAVRNIRRDAIEILKKMEKESKITEDDITNCLLYTSSCV